MNVDDRANVSVRPMVRADVDALAAWAAHRDPLYRHYDIPPQSRSDRDGLWAMLSGAPDIRRPYAALAGGRVVGSLIVRPLDDGGGDIGIILDPAIVGRGFGRRILTAFATVLRSEGFRRLQLDVAGYNGRALAAYRAAGFVVTGERWAEAEPGLDPAALLAGSARPELAPHVRSAPAGRYDVRTVRMELRLDDR